MKRQWTKATALAYCAKASKTETYGLKYWSARDYLKLFRLVIMVKSNYSTYGWR